MKSHRMDEERVDDCVRRILYAGPMLNAVETLKPVSHFARGFSSHFGLLESAPAPRCVYMRSYACMPPHAQAKNVSNNGAGMML